MLTPENVPSSALHHTVRYDVQSCDFTFGGEEEKMWFQGSGELQGWKGNSHYRTGWGLGKHRVQSGVDMLFFSNLVTFLSCTLGGGSHPPKVSSSVHVSWLSFLGICCIFIYVELFAFRIVQRGNLQSGCKKVIWQFIFRAALLPAACFKLNLWHKDIHHFNCMLLFSQAQICFILFSFSCGGRLPPPNTHCLPWKKEKKKKRPKIFPHISPNQTLFIVKEFITPKCLVFQCCIFGS